LQPNGPIDEKPDKTCRLLGRNDYRPRQAKTAETEKHPGKRERPQLRWEYCVVTDLRLREDDDRWTEEVADRKQ